MHIEIKLEMWWVQSLMKVWVNLEHLIYLMDFLNGAKIMHNR